jgi:hypothetical protein
MKSVRPVGTGVPDDAAGAGCGIDNQLGARAEDAPFRVATGHLECVPVGLPLVR